MLHLSSFADWKGWILSRSFKHVRKAPGRILAAAEGNSETARARAKQADVAECVLPSLLMPPIGLAR